LKQAVGSVMLYPRNKMKNISFYFGPPAGRARNTVCKLHLIWAAYFYIDCSLQHCKLHRGELFRYRSNGGYTAGLGVNYLDKGVTPGGYTVELDVNYLDNGVTEATQLNSE